MHWYWIDRFTKFVSGQSAQTIKMVSRAEDHLADHFPFYPIMPASLIIEGLAQTGGLLIHESQNFLQKVVLAKIQKITFYEEEVIPGDCLLYDAVVDYISDEGSMITVSVQKNGKLIAEGSLVFAHLGNEYASQDLFSENELVDLVRAYGLYDVGVHPDGSRIIDPALQNA